MLAGDSPQVRALFEAELDLVDIIARQVARWLGPHADLDELVSTGREGLFDAARRFETTRGSSFRAYANYRVLGAVIDGVRKMARVPRRVHERLAAERAVSLVALQEVGPAWQFERLDEKELDDGFADHLAALATAAALGAEAAGDADPLESWSPNPEQAFEKAEQVARVRDALQTLSVNDAEILRRYYYDGQTLEQIATDLDVSRSWACRLHGRAVDRLAERLGEKDQ